MQITRTKLGAAVLTGAITIWAFGSSSVPAEAAVEDDTWHCVPTFDIEHGDIHTDYDDDELLHNVEPLDWQHVSQGEDGCGEAHTWANN